MAVIESPPPTSQLVTPPAPPRKRAPAKPVEPPIPRPRAIPIPPSSVHPHAPIPALIAAEMKDMGPSYLTRDSMIPDNGVGMYRTPRAQARFLTYSSWAVVEPSIGDTDFEDFWSHKAQGSKVHKAAETRKRMAAFLGHVENGRNLKESAALVGISMAGVDRWRQVYPDFKANLATARSRYANRDLDDDTKTKRVVEKGFTHFRTKYFKQPLPNGRHHYEIAQLLETAEPRSISTALVFPGAGKTSIIEDWICYTLANDPNHRFLVISKSLKHARKILGKISRRLKDESSRFVAEFGPFYEEGQQDRGKPWTQSFFTVAKAGHDERDYSLEAMGWNGQIYGARVDTVILDDVQVTENLNQADEILDRFMLDVYSRPIDSGGRIFIIGTRIGNYDLYGKMIDQGTTDNLVLLPIIDSEGVPLWPEKYPLDVLLGPDYPDTLGGVRGKYENAGRSHIWWTSWMQQPQVGDRATFSVELLETAKDPTRTIGQRDFSTPCVLALDPAISGGNALSCIEYTTNHMHLVDMSITYELRSWEPAINEIERFCANYQPSALIIEKNAYQGGLAQSERIQEISRRYGLQLIDHFTGRHKIDPNIGVPAMEVSFYRSEISFPDGDPLTRARLEPFITQLNNWRPDVPTRLLPQDGVMSFWFGWSYIMSQRKAMSVRSNAWSRVGVPYRPLAAKATRLV